MQRVIKRDGKIVDFNSEKIKIAISKSAEKIGEMSEQDIDRITDIIVNKCERQSGDQISVEQIQDLVYFETSALASGIAARIILSMISFLP